MSRGLLKTIIFTVALLLVIGMLFFLTGCTDPPVAGINVNKNVVRLGESVQFSDRSSGEVTSWTWDFGDGDTSAEQNPVHIFREKGVFLVKLSVGNKGGDSSTEMNITVLQDPAADFTVGKDKALVGEEIMFSDKSSGDIDSYLWDFGDGTTSVEKNPSHIYDSRGSYTVSLEVSNELNSNTEVKNIEILAPAKADFVLSATIIETTDEIEFTDSSTGDISSYQWDFGDGSDNVTEQNPSHKYWSAGHYSVSLTVSNALSSDTKNFEVQVLNKARASFYITPTYSYSNSNKTTGLPNYAMAGNPINFADDSTGDIDSYSWDFGDGTTSTEQNPEHVYNKVGTYTVTLTVINLANSDSRVMEDYIIIGNLNLTMVMCSSVTSGGIYTPQPGAVFHENDPMVLYFEISGFEQDAVSGGYEIWLEVLCIVVATENRGFVNDMENLPEIHETNQNLASSVSIGENLLPYYFPSKYDVRVVVIDRLSGNVGVATITYTIE